MTAPGGPAAHHGERPHFADLYAAEQRHFWFRHRCRVLGELFAGLVADLPDGYRVLEVGCGNGSVLEVLEAVCRRGRVTGSELFAEGLEFARQRVRCPLVAADVYDLPFGPEFDVVGMFDVLEHLPDDLQALRCLRGVLRPGGRVVLTVPARPTLWSYADVASGHYRRYSVPNLAGALQAAGFRVLYLTEFMAPLYPLMRLGRALAAFRNRLRRAPRDEMALAHDEFRVHPLVNAALSWLLAAERPLLRRRKRLPAGTSVLAVADVPACAASLAA